MGRPNGGKLTVYVDCGMSPCPNFPCRLHCNALLSFIPSLRFLLTTLTIQSSITILVVRLHQRRPFPPPPQRLWRLRRDNPLLSRRRARWRW
jgi:hypothetical protein